MRNNFKFILLGIIFSFIGCKTSPQFVHPRGYEKSPSPFQSDTIFAWKVDTVCSPKDIVYYEFPPIEEMKNLSEIKRTFYNKNGVLLHRELNNSDYTIALTMPSETNIIKMRGKILYSTSISKYGVTDWSEIFYDELGNIREISVEALKEPLFFIKGTGHYINVECLITYDTISIELAKKNELYTKYDSIGLASSLHYIYLDQSNALKIQKRSYVTEEGQLENNYKVGEWKYYNSDGTIKETREYKFKDKVDIRFPYCLFNKKEPCFCDSDD